MARSKRRLLSRLLLLLLAVTLIFTLPFRWLAPPVSSARRVFASLGVAPAHRGVNSSDTPPPIIVEERANIFRRLIFATAVKRANISFLFI